MSPKYKFMSFKGPKNIIGNGLIILALLWFVWPAGKAMFTKRTMCSCGTDKNGIPDGMTAINSSSTIGGTKKYFLAPSAQEQVVTRKSIGLYAPRA